MFSVSSTFLSKCIVLHTWLEFNWIIYSFKLNINITFEDRCLNQILEFGPNLEFAILEFGPNLAQESTIEASKASIPDFSRRNGQSIYYESPLKIMILLKICSLYFHKWKWMENLKIINISFLLFFFFFCIINEFSKDRILNDHNSFYINILLNKHKV